MQGTAGEESFHALLCLHGEGAILAGGESLPIAKGQSLFIPAGMGDYRLAGDMTMLRTTL